MNKKNVKIAYIVLDNYRSKASDISPILPNMPMEEYFMRQIRRMGIYNFDKDDFLIVTTNMDKIENTIIKLYKIGVRLFISSLTTDGIIIAQDIFTKYNLNDAILFDTSSSGYVPRTTSPTNIFRYSTIDLTALNDIIILLINYIPNSCFVTDSSQYSLDIVSILQENGVVFIEPNEYGEYFGQQFNNYSTIFLITADYDFLRDFNQVANDFNDSKNLILSDLFTYEYSEIIYNTVSNIITELQIPSYKNIFSWCSCHVADNFKFSEILFDGRVVNTTILDILSVLDYVYQAYKSQEQNKAKYMYELLDKIGIIYTKKTEKYNPGDHITRDYILAKCELISGELKWDSIEVNINNRITKFPGMETYISKIIDLNEEPQRTSLKLSNSVYEYFIDNIKETEMQGFIYTIGLPSDYTLAYEYKQYTIHFEFKIYEAINTEYPNLSDEKITKINLTYNFDPNIPSKLTPNNFKNTVDKLYHESNIKIDDLNLSYDILFDAENNNLAIIFIASSNYYYIIVSDILIDPVYPDIVSRDFVVRQYNYILHTKELTTEQQIQIANINQIMLYNSTNEEIENGK